MAAQRPSSLLLAFKAKIEESVALVPGMAPDEKLKAVQFWNVVSENLQDIVNDSAADINALALNMHSGDGNVAPLGDDQCSQAKMAHPYMEEHAYRSENLYTEAVEEFSVAATAEGHQQELLALSAELEQVGATQSAAAQGTFHGVAVEPGNELVVTQEALPKDSTVLLISTQVEGDHQGEAAPFHVSSQQGHSIDLTLQMPVGTANQDQVKKEAGSWQPCEEHAPKPKAQSKRRPAARKAAARSGSSKKATTAGGRQAAGAAKAAEPKHADTVPEVLLECTGSIGTTEVIVIQTRKKSKRTKEEKDRQCKVCLKVLPSNSSLTAHMWTHEKPFVCIECNARFSTKNNLVVHERSHSGEKPYACGECKACFSTRGNLKRHVKTHLGVRPWKCSHCEQCFTEKKTMVAHMRRHTGEKPYQCEVCQRCFTQSGVLQTHMAVHLGQKAHLCEHCGKAFRQRSQLHLHMQRHQGLRRYSCDLCPARFLTKADMLRHERTHTGERPFGCDLCGKKFTRQQSLNEHTNRHYGIKPFECKYCDKSFAEMSACYKHMKLHSRNGENTGGAPSALKTSEAATAIPEPNRTSAPRAGSGPQAPTGREAAVPSSASSSATDAASASHTPELSAMDLLAAASGF